MKILGLGLGYNSTAALLIDNRIIACVSEERFTHEKNDESYPYNAINYVLEEGGCEGEELDAVVIASNSLNLTIHLMRTYSRWAIEDHIKAMHQFWYPKLYENREVNFYDLFSDKMDVKQYPGTWSKLIDNIAGYFSTEDSEKYRKFVHQVIHEHIGIPLEKISHIEHHTCHSSYAYWGSPLRGEDVLVITADAFGDGVSSTLSTIGKNGRIERRHEISESEFTIARLYRYITLLMGMKPDEHEYKVMGLAPYAKPYVWKKAYDVFRKGMYVDGIDVKFHEKPKDHYFWFKERLEGVRFDGIAGGLQKYTEEILTEYVQNAMKHFDCSKLVYSGGVSMNIKANMLIKDLDVVEDMFICGSGGDESIALGACYAYAAQAGRTNLEPVSNLYLGPQNTKAEVDKVLAEVQTEGYFIKEASNDLISDMLIDGKVLGRCCGRMEFGARSLGNRSILADPRNRSITQVINDKIKNRDFWMPFAPSIMAEHAHEYLVNPKQIFSPFMTIGFDSTEKGAECLVAGSHPADRTLRPQMVRAEDNPDYHALIDAFYEKTGCGGVLNTSFNLHGKPIVNSCKEAYDVFKKTDIDALILNKHIILKG